MDIEDITKEILEKVKYLSMGISIVIAAYVIYKFTETKIKNPDISISKIINYTLKTGQVNSIELYIGGTSLVLTYLFNIFTL